MTDKPEILKQAGGFLRGLGYDIRKTSSCAGARRTARLRATINLVLAGPVLKLRPALRLVRWFRSASPPTPVLLMRSSLAEANQCLLESERVAILLRPFTLEQLAKAVRHLLDDRAARLKPTLRRHAGLPRATAAALEKPGVT